MTERVVCYRCGHRTNRIFREYGDDEVSILTAFGTHANCGGMYVRPETLRQWNEWDRAACSVENLNAGELARGIE